MGILILALLFGVAVMVFLIVSMARNKKAGNSKLVTVLKIIIAVETIIYLAVFVIVFIKTMAM